MTIQSPTARASFVCNSVSTVFPVNIQAYLATDFLVLLTNAAGSTTLNLNSDYTLVASGSLSPPFWSLTTQTGQFVSPYVIGNTLQVILNPSETQLTQYTQGQAFPSLAVQTNLDRLTQMVIRQTDQLSRSLHAPDTDVSPLMLLPSASLRALRYQAYDTNGNAIVVAALPAATNPPAPYPQLAGEVGVVNLQYVYGDLRRYNCDLSGVTDSTTLFQNACTSIGALGGGIVFHPGGTVMVNQAVKLSSNTILQGVGNASLIRANPSYVGIQVFNYSTQTSHMIGNVNYGATVLTDHDIVVRDISFDWGAVTITNGGAFSISFHFVNRVLISNVYSKVGDNVTALLSCLDTVTFDCHGENCRNAYFDDWGGASSIKVLFCTGRTNPGCTPWLASVAYAAGNQVISGAGAGTIYTCITPNTNSLPPNANWTTGPAAATTLQGIQFTGTGSLSEAGQATNCVAAFNELYGIRNGSGTSSAYIANSNAANSSTVRYKTFGNYAENCDNGWVAQGAFGQCLSIGDVFNLCRTGSPIFFNSDTSGLPSNCRIISPTLIDCSHVAGNIAMIVINGTNNRVENVNVFSPNGVLYTFLVWFPVTAVNCYASIDKAPNGITASRISNQSTTSLAKDMDDLDAWPYAGVLPTIASAATIAPILGVTFISGSTTVSTITVPPGCLNGGSITLISTGTWVTNTAGNIILASTPILNKPLVMTYVPSSGKWYPGY